MVKKKTLGELLEQKIKEEEQDKLLKLQREVQQKTEKEQKALKVVVDFVKDIKEAIIEDIGSGKNVRKILLGTDGRKDHNAKVAEILNTYSGDNFFLKSKYNPVWEELLDWGKQEGLIIKFDYRHDGGGMYSWYELEVKPLSLVKVPTKRKSGI